MVINKEDYDPARHHIYGEVAGRPDDPGIQMDGQGLEPIAEEPVKAVRRGRKTK